MQCSASFAAPMHHFFGTKNLLDHVRQCKGVNASVGQLKIMQCFQQGMRAGILNNEFIVS